MKDRIVKYLEALIEQVHRHYAEIIQDYPEPKKGEERAFFKALNNLESQALEAEDKIKEVISMVKAAPAL